MLQTRSSNLLRVRRKVPSELEVAPKPLVLSLVCYRLSPACYPLSPVRYPLTEWLVPTFQDELMLDSTRMVFGVLDRGGFALYQPLLLQITIGVPWGWKNKVRSSMRYPPNPRFNPTEMKEHFHSSSIEAITWLIVNKCHYLCIRVCLVEEGRKPKEKDKVDVTLTEMCHHHCPVSKLGLLCSHIH